MVGNVLIPSLRLLVSRETGEIGRAVANILLGVAVMCGCSGFRHHLQNEDGKAAG
jgi:hypothetical protein